ncbi:MAG: glycosyltransferase family 4 protein [Flavobacteriales bacterium]
MELYLVNLYFPYVLAFFLAAITVYFTVPVIIRVAKLKNLYDEPNEERKASKIIVPTLGGAAIFLGFVLAVVLSSFRLEFNELRYIVAALVILLFVGLKDDILYISPKSKLVGQLFVAFILVFFADVRFTNLHGILGIHDIHYWISVPLSMFAIVVLTNSMNLIDGIDGLCSGIGVSISVIYALLFYLNEEVDFALLALALAGALISFFIFNVFGKKNKIFMGDTGSLMVGFLVSIMTVKFNEIPLPDHRLLQIVEIPAISVAIMIVPVIDTLRVFSLRILDGRSPFSADRWHTHHQLLDLGLPHFKASLIYISYHIIFVIIALVLQYYISDYILLIVLVALALMFISIPSLILKRRKKAIEKENELKNNIFNRFFTTLADRH